MTMTGMQLFSDKVDSVSVNNMHLSRRVKTLQPRYFKDLTIAQLGSICRQNCAQEASLYDEFGVSRYKYFC